MSDPLICYFALFSRTLEPILIRNYLVNHLKHTTDLSFLTLESIKMQMALQIYQLLTPIPPQRPSTVSTDSGSSLKQLNWSPVAQLTVSSLLLDIYILEHSNGLKTVVMTF